MSLLFLYEYNRDEVLWFLQNVFKNPFYMLHTLMVLSLAALINLSFTKTNA
jgi:hypothetical protein